ncbi:MAG: NrtA/SsuA/CpmA family ABC transporter substrate-binding protein [Pseudomonadota bacterium]
MQPVRRRIIGAIAAAALSMFTLPAVVHAQTEKVIKVGTLKLIHAITPYFYEQFAPPGYKIQVIPFESPTDGKNAVVTGTVDFGTFGIAAAMLGAAAGEPVVVFAPQCNGGMAVVAGVNSDIKSVRDLKGRKVAIWPGSTQEVVILERLKAEGMTIKDIQSIRLPFSDMAPALARGDIDAYVGAEPGPGISLANGVGKIVEYPYSTPIGSLNMVWATRQEMIDKNPELVKVMMEMHRKATDFAMANRAEMVKMTMQKLGQQQKSIELAAPNVQLTWKIDDEFIRRAKAYGQLMLEKKQIRELPNFDKFITAKFMPAAAVAQK